MSNAMDLNAVNALVSDFDQKIKTPIIDEVDQLHTKARDRTYELVAGLVELAEKLDVENPTAGYISFLTERGLRKPTAKQNPYPVFIKAVFSVLKNDAWVFGKTERSYEKHANHVRFLTNEKRANNLHGKTVQDFIRGYEVQVSYQDEPIKALRAIEHSDREANPSKSAAAAKKTVRDRGKKAQPKAIIAETFSANEGEVVKLWGRVKNGQLEVMKLSVANDDEADSLFYKLGREIPA